jgi:hypothetical protein
VPALLVYREDTLERRVDLTGRSLCIGRGSQNDLILDDEEKTVSRFHAELRYENGLYVVIDLRSQNGTWIEGRRVQREALRAGVPVVLGAYRLVLEQPVHTAEDTVLGTVRFPGWSKGSGPSPPGAGSVAVTPAGPDVAPACEKPFRGGWHYGRCGELVVEMLQWPGRLTLEYPPAQWMTVAAPALLMVVERNGGASMVIEEQHFSHSTASLGDSLAELEGHFLREREPESEKLMTQVIRDEGRLVVLIDYTRPGPNGILRVRQYSFPAGRRLYRLRCAALFEAFSGHEPVFAHMAASFRPSESQP